MRILFAVHHHLDPNEGAPGAMIRLGAAMRKAGCDVEYFSYDEAFPGKQGRISFSLGFPWRLASFLRRNAYRFDVIDVHTGDNWVWAMCGRPGAHSGQILVTRSHGLEHTADARLRQEVRKGKVRISWKYPIYHGGYRLWEVKKSLEVADIVLLLNQMDKDYAENDLRIPAIKLNILPNGIADSLIDLPEPEYSTSNAIRLAFIGRWTPAKGADVLVKATRLLVEAGVALELTVLGSSADERSVLRDFDPSLRSIVNVIPRYRNEDLPGLLSQHELFVFPTVSEGFSLALIEAMACGLVPIATSVGGAPMIIQPGKNGILVPVGDTESIVAAVSRLTFDREKLAGMRRQAQKTAHKYSWDTIASKTLHLYRSAIGS